MADIGPGPDIDMALETALDADTISADGGVRAVGEVCGCCELFEAKVGNDGCCDAGR